ncbi:MAG TPA: bifunctional UDP-N-acetylmuramoyl-tripeptide:D-alanyl-D-alanine ligase/alanine racemase [Bacteroidales bacterium]|nr:bifunctional UDP-N-acetylmuramoyl-tripeptide:D-alanyl-D-alanine ligase/alanine racemase [Bacteroidales bacterium]
MEYSISEIVSIVNGNPSSSPFIERNIRDILIDSRKLIAPEQCLFFALKSKRNDGHHYIPELYGKGIRDFVVSRLPADPEAYPEANFILVKNTLHALQALARKHREKFRIPVVGITGSNGKTIVKEWLYQLLSKSRKTVRSPKSYNSQIGVPLSVWQMDTPYEMAIFEAGISEPDEMIRLETIIQPTIGVFTNIGEAHGENFMSLQQKVGEKLFLFTHVETLIYCLDHPEVREVIIRSGISKNIKTFTWSHKQEADLRIREVRPENAHKTNIRAVLRGREISITIPFSDNASVENAIHCWSVMLLLGYEAESLTGLFEALQPIAMRLELKAGINHCTVINDSYNSDINSLSIAIDFLRQQASQKKKTIIISDILQSGKDEDELYGEIAAIIRNKNIDRLIGIGPAISRQADKFSLEKSFFQNTADFLQRFSFAAFNNEVILLKGARVFEFEQISLALQQKTHETVLEINLNALEHNLNYYRSVIRPGTKIMAMVKAFSYGIGSFEVANALQFHRIDYLAVAYADEGVELRKAGINVPIMVMNPDEESFDAIIQHSLEPEIYSHRIFDKLENAIKKNILPKNKPVKIHIKLDTGMHRLGFLEEDLDRLIDMLKANRMIYVQSVFSHLAASEDKKETDFTRCQIENFRRMASKITDQAGHPVMMHILNSAGITCYPEAQFDMVRLGISLYGIATLEEEQPRLQPVGRLKSAISQIKTVAAGESIGYNRAFRAKKQIRMAIVPIGYADGLSLALSNGKGHLMVGGKRVPVIGRVCMDMCMLDITGIEAEEGDEVIIFGPERPLQELAKEMGTIPYEVLAGLSRRVKRVYYHE